MPGRKTPLVNDHYYHIYNRGVDLRPVFIDKRNYQMFLDLLNYYRFSNTLVSFSKLKMMSQSNREDILVSLKENGKKMSEIIAFCLMPNHFHLLVKQVENEGISKFLSQIQNSYTKYFNKKHNRVGPLFQGKFKSVLVETEKQLLHLTRYIHLNPYSAVVVKEIEQLFDYPWLSLRQYLKLEEGICDFEKVVNVTGYKQFLCDQADYQRQLEKVKHLIIE